MGAPDISQHGYSLLFAIVLAEAIGLPFPAALALLIAGASSGHGPLHPGSMQWGMVLLTAMSALLLGDCLLFLLGRWTGWWLLGLLCKFSLDPDACLLRSASSFRRRGRIMLLFAKFIPGINALAPPLAGGMNMRFRRFFPLDAAGALLYASVYVGLGFLCSNFLDAVIGGYEKGSRIILLVVAAAVVLYIGYHLWLLVRGSTLAYVPKVSAAEIARALYSKSDRDDVVVFDVRSHGYYNKNARRIKQSIRLEPNTLLDHLEKLPKDKEIALYCTCLREGTSLKVARILQQHGFRSSVIRGGLRAWKKAGFPLETVPPDDIVALPMF